jgi:ABC-type dipeptide/oligopeptide/nickel transport system permease subunit
MGAQADDATAPTSVGDLTAAKAGPVASVPDVNSVPTSRARASRRRLRTFLSSWTAVAAGFWLFALAVISVFAWQIAPHDPNHADLLHIFAGPSGEHWLGTDSLGRDVFSRLIVATRISMFASVAAVSASLILAVPLGMLAGYFGGWLDRIIGFGTDVILSVPPLILVFAIAGVLGPSLHNAVVALAVYFTPMFIRLVRTETQRVRYSQLTEAEQSIGLPHWQILARHVLPNITPSLVVQTALTLGTALLAEASLSFLGLGVRPPGASWGTMLRTAYDNFLIHPWQVVAPAVAIASAVLAWNLFADGVRAAFGRVES